jgi:hypothetical protein
VLLRWARVWHAPAGPASAQPAEPQPVPALRA